MEQGSRHTLAGSINAEGRIRKEWASELTPFGGGGCSVLVMDPGLVHAMQVPLS